MESWMVAGPDRGWSNPIWPELLVRPEVAACGWRLRRALPKKGCSLPSCCCCCWPEVGARRPAAALLLLTQI
ncbi:hypothetical protein RHGRI_001636 [Rhododendron griersonianum]|uniref:Uncharacterized protein n=1 Tax=Rhododendron griersonianum TaxID=479676 RepID=A0AAV6LKW0_9ERIC|nr:hypothetical protein RHGRI_001636 [Rhododendron griersonianum]